MIIVPPIQPDFALQHEYSIRSQFTDETFDAIVDESPRSFGTLGNVPVSSVRVERTQYNFATTLRGEYGWRDGYTFRVPQAHLTLKGIGETFTQARRDWEHRFHALFQRLYSTPSFEMSSDEATEWKRIRSQIDINAYSDLIPLTAREIGQIRFGAASYPTEIQWVDGRRERILLDRVPRIIAGSRPGQFVEAWVERDPLTKQISQIILAERIGSLHPLNEAQRKARWANLPRAKLPTTDWDWPDRDQR